MIPIVMTCDPYLWAMRPFAYLFNTYWSSQQRVVVACYKMPDFDLPSNFIAISLGPDPGPKNWSDGLIKILQHGNHDIVCILLEDYWLSRTADVTGIATLSDYMALNPDILRIDLTTDRLYNGDMRDTGSHWGHYDLIETPHDSPYQMSLQAGLWRKSLLLDLLKTRRSPWQVELQTKPPPEMRVLGTRQYPLRYINALRSGDPITVHDVNRLEPQHQQAIARWILTDGGQE